MRKKTIEEYSSRALNILKGELFELYHGLGALADNLYLIGGLACDLLVKNKLPYLTEYLGTTDIDLAVRFVGKISPAPESLYDILRELNFERDKAKDGSDLLSHSFIKRVGPFPVVVDLITDAQIPPESDKLVELAPRVDAVKFRGVYLVFNDYIKREIRRGEEVIRIKIPGIVPFITLKAFAYDNEHDPKDAYDIWYSVSNFEEGPKSVLEELKEYEDNQEVKDALKIIKRMFAHAASYGIIDVCNILTGRYNLERGRSENEVITPFSIIFTEK